MMTDAKASRLREIVAHQIIKENVANHEEKPTWETLLSSLKMTHSNGGKFWISTK